MVIILKIILTKIPNLTHASFLVLKFSDAISRRLRLEPTTWPPPHLWPGWHRPLRPCHDGHSTQAVIFGGQKKHNKKPRNIRHFHPFPIANVHLPMIQHWLLGRLLDPGTSLCPLGFQAAIWAPWPSKAHWANSRINSSKSFCTCAVASAFHVVLSYPIGSMYGIYIYANIGGILMVNVTIYGIHGSYGYVVSSQIPVQGGQESAQIACIMTERDMFPDHVSCESDCREADWEAPKARESPMNQGQNLTNLPMIRGNGHGIPGRKLDFWIVFLCNLH